MAPCHEIYAGHALRPISRNKPIIDMLLSIRYQKVFFFFFIVMATTIMVKIFEELIRPH